MSNIIVPTDPDDRQILRNAIEEVDAAMTRKEAEQDKINDILKETEERVEIPKKVLRKMAKIYHDASLEEMKTETEDIETLYTNVFDVGE